MRAVQSFRVLSSLAFWLLAVAIGMPVTSESQTGITEAPTGFNVVSNGFAEEFCKNQAGLVNSPNSPMIPAEDCSFAEAVARFTGPAGIADGLGPIYNSDSCGSCHLTPILGGSSQMTEKRAGRFDGTTFFQHPGGSLIQDRATDIRIQELVNDTQANVVAHRGTISLLGAGFVEAIPSGTLQNIANAQPTALRGQIINVPVLERPGTTRTGRFGWKDQHASLVSAAAQAYNNDMGITSPLQLDEPTSNGFSVAGFDTVPDPDDDGVDVEFFALFMRSTLAPPRDAQRAATADAQAGSSLFSSIGCATCHTRSIVTAVPSTLINGGALRVAQSLGNKRIRPFSDFLLHDIGTGDGIVENGGQSTRNKIRTAPLWGLRSRGRFMHDSLSSSLLNAIQRHGGQAASSRSAFNALSSINRNRVLAFLLSL